MSAILARAYPPQEALWDLDRLAVLAPLAETPAAETPDVEQVDWEEVHRVVQRILAGMARRVERAHPWIRIGLGKTSGRGFWLFSYAQFDVPADHGINGIGVGVLFRPTAAGDKVVVEGDIVREEAGDLLFELEEAIVANRRLDVVAAAQQAAQRLSAQVDCVVEGLRQPCWPESI